MNVELKIRMGGAVDGLTKGELGAALRRTGNGPARYATSIKDVSTLHATSIQATRNATTWDRRSPARRAHRKIGGPRGLSGGDESAG